MGLSIISAMVRRLRGAAAGIAATHKGKAQPMWRQGDVFIARVPQIPVRVRKSPLPHGILVHGELTGHSHRLDNPKSASLYAGSGQIGEMFLDVPQGGARIVHEEHGTQ